MMMTVATKPAVISGIVIAWFSLLYRAMMNTTWSLSFLVSGIGPNMSIDMFYKGPRGGNNLSLSCLLNRRPFDLTNV